MIDSEFDLHEENIRTKEELYYFLDKIITEAYHKGDKNIRIITGRGNNSKNRPLLKPVTDQYLKSNKLVDHYRLDLSLGAFEIWLSN